LRFAVAGGLEPDAQEDIEVFAAHGLSLRHSSEEKAAADFTI